MIIVCSGYHYFVAHHFGILLVLPNVFDVVFILLFVVAIAYSHSHTFNTAQGKPCPQAIAGNHLGMRLATTLG